MGADLLACAFGSYACLCVCIFSFHVSHSQTERDESCVWMVSSLFKCDSLFPFWGGVSDHDPVLLSVIPSAQRGTVCLHHAGLPSTAVLLFHTLFIDHEKRDIFHIPLSLFNPIFVLVRLD